MSKNSALKQARGWVEEEDWVGMCGCNVMTKNKSHTEETREQWCACYREHVRRLSIIDKALELP